MKVFPCFRMAVLLGLGCALAGPRAGAQGLILSVSTSPDVIGVGDTLTYSIDVTNLTGGNFDPFSAPAFVTNSLSGPANITGVTTNPPVSVVSSSASQAVFNLGQFPVGIVAHMSVIAQSTAAGYITNTITVAAPFSFTNLVTAYVVNEVTNAGPSSQADLAVGLFGPPQAVITNDYMPYRVTITNLGPDSAVDVILTNEFADQGVTYQSMMPPDVPGTNTGAALLFYFGTLGNGAVTNVAITVQPTNAGPLGIDVSVGSSTADPNTTNNTASVNLDITNYLAGLLEATNVGPLVYDPQTGLMEQTVRLTNLGSNSVASARVVVGSLSNWLYDAVGTNDGNPFVYYAGSLDTNQSVDLRLEYFVPTRLPVAVTNFMAYEVPAVNLSIPAGYGTPFGVYMTTNMPYGNLVDFESTSGRGYTIIYADNDAFSNAVVALSPIIAPANRVMWIDAGPPKTLSFPTNGTPRYYRVLPNP